MTLETNNPQLRIAADCLRQLVEVTAKFHAVLSHDVSNCAVCYGDIRLDDLEMAIREAREFLGETPDCHNGSCKL